MAIKLPLDGDEIANLEVSRNILTGYHSVTVYSEWKFWHHPPLYYAILHPLSYDPFYARMLSVLLTCLTLIVVYRLGNGLAQLFYTFIPTAIIFGVVIRPDIPMLLAMMLTLLLFRNHPNWALAVSTIGINIKYQFAAVLVPIFLMDRKAFVKFSIADALALIPFGLVSYLNTGDFLLFSHWSQDLGVPTFTDAFPTDLMVLYLTVVCAVATLKDRKLGIYLALIIANLLMVTLVSPAKFAFKVTYYYLPCFAAGTIALDSYTRVISKRSRFVVLIVFVLILLRQSRFLIDILF